MELRVTQLAKRFGEVVAVEAADLHVRSGELLTLLGPSGCGKTTTLRMIAGLEHPSAGRIAVGDTVFYDAAAGREVAPEDRRIGMVFQSYAVWPHLTVFENIAFPLRVRRTAAAELERRVREALKLVRLDALGERYPAALSGGQQQRVALARAIVGEPRLLLLDEPLSNLDAALREELRLEIRSVQQRLGITTVLVTHDQAEALALSDQVAVMNAGRIVQTGAPREIYEQPASPFVAGFVGWKNVLPAAAVGERSGTIACRPEDVEIVAPGDGLAGTVRATLYMATHTVLEIALGESTLIAHAGADARFAAGATVGVRLRPNRIRVFPERA